MRTVESYGRCKAASREFSTDLRTCTKMMHSRGSVFWLCSETEEIECKSDNKNFLFGLSGLAAIPGLSHLTNFGCAHLLSHP